MTKTYLEYFKEICCIPHGSGNTSQIKDYCVEFAKEHGLEFYTDELNNVVIRKPASKGYEGHETVVLQGHLDMVCEKDPDVDFDFAKDSLKLRTEGDFLMATGTTLGGDDGIAIAIMLCILSDNSLSHPALECVFTTDEETGMFGAAGIDAAQITGRKLINIDSEDEGIFTVGCAGGARCEVTLESETIDASGIFVDLTVSGLTGGHSGVEINKGRLNSNVVLIALLSKMAGKGMDFNLCKVQGGSKDNVITNKTECTVSLVNESLFADLCGLIAEFIEEVKVDTDPNLTIDLKKSDKLEEKALTFEKTKEVVSMLSKYPNGVQKMSDDIEGLPQTSLNFAVVELVDGKLTLRFSVRSSVTQEKLDLIKELEEISSQYGASFMSDGHYPAWEYRKNSNLRDTMVSVYEKMYGNKPKIEVIHAGLECGLFSEKLEGLDAVSIGPDLYDIHSPKERMSLSSAQRVYEFVIETLKNL